MSHTNNCIEIELKYWLDEPEKLLKWLGENAKLEHESHQIDVYFTPAHKNYFDEKYPSEYFRIRKSGEKYSTAYKGFHATEVEGVYSHCDEYETEVENGEEFKKIVDALGFKPLVTVDKLRKSYKYKNFEIEVDDVKDLGGVCEIEIQSDYENVDKAREQIRSFATEIGLKENEDIPNLKMGYAVMIAKKQGILK